MVDLTDFRKYKILYLVIILFVAITAALLTAPSNREVYVDISVEPPESVRKTDFSWITVNEWFVTQACLIKSDAILGGIESDIGKEKLDKNLSVNRLGAANILRVSISTTDVEDLEKNKKLLSVIADLYLRQLAKPKETAAANRPAKDEMIGKIDERELADDRCKIESQIAAAKKRVEENESRLNLIESKPGIAQRLKTRLVEVDKTLVLFKAELVRLETIYTDKWPAIVKLREQIAIGEKERRNVARDYKVAQEAEDKLAVLINDIQTDKKNIDALQAKIQEMDNRSSSSESHEEQSLIISEQPLEKAAPANRIITAPTENRQTRITSLGIRLLAACCIGIIFWFFLGLVLKNAYLYWIIKNKIFSNK